MTSDTVEIASAASPSFACPPSSTFPESAMQRMMVRMTEKFVAGVGILPLRESRTTSMTSMEYSTFDSPIYGRGSMESAAMNASMRSGAISESSESMNTNRVSSVSSAGAMPVSLRTSRAPGVSRRNS